MLEIILDEHQTKLFEFPQKNKLVIDVMLRNIFLDKIKDVKANDINFNRLINALDTCGSSSLDLTYDKENVIGNTNIVTISFNTESDILESYKTDVLQEIYQREVTRVRNDISTRKDTKTRQLENFATRKLDIEKRIEVAQKSKEDVSTLKEELANLESRGINSQATLNNLNKRLCLLTNRSTLDEMINSMNAIPVDDKSRQFERQFLDEIVRNTKEKFDNFLEARFKLEYKLQTYQNESPDSVKTSYIQKVVNLFNDSCRKFHDGFSKLPTIDKIGLTTLGVLTFALLLSYNLRPSEVKNKDNLQPSIKKELVSIQRGIPQNDSDAILAQLQTNQKQREALTSVIQGQRKEEEMRQKALDNLIPPEKQYAIYVVEVNKSQSRNPWEIQQSYTPFPQGSSIGSGTVINFNPNAKFFYSPTEAPGSWRLDSFNDSSLYIEISLMQYTTSEICVGIESLLTPGIIQSYTSSKTIAPRDKIKLTLSNQSASIRKSQNEQK